MQDLGVNRTIVNLPLTGCIIMDMPLSRMDCSRWDRDVCLACPLLGRFISGEGMDDFGSVSHVVCFIIGVLAVLIGTFGAIANLLIMIVLKRQKSDRGFDTMLIGLAGIDLICSVTSVITAISSIAYFQNWSRGIINVYLFWLGTHSTIFSRSGSSFQTVLITFERYLCVAFTLQTRHWFTAKRSRIMTAGVFIFSFVFLALPRYTSLYVQANEYKHFASTQRVDYLIRSTRLQYFWYVTMGRYFDLIDFWSPLPILLLMNGLIYVHILRFMARRKDLNMKQKKDIRAVKMFLPVVIVLFVCNIIPIIDNISIVFYGVITREVHMALLLSNVVNSAANLPIYYYRGSSFKKETRALLSSLFPSLERYYSVNYGESGARVTAASVSGTSRSNDTEMGGVERSC